MFVGMEEMGPFGTSPYPSALFLTPALKDTLRLFRTVINTRQGLAVLTGDLGYGKSSLLRLMYSDYDADETVDAVLIPMPSFSTPFAFMRGICEELGIPPARSLYAQQQALERYLLECVEKDRNVVVFIDEAQVLSNPMLETIRWMMNIETDEMKLIQFILAGQIELWSRITNKRNRAIRSRVFVSRTMPSMTLEETRKVLEHRCEYNDVPFPFSNEAVERIQQYSLGVPRQILQMAQAAWQRRHENNGALVIGAEFIDETYRMVKQADQAKEAATNG